MFFQRRRVSKTVFLATFFALICSPGWAANSYYVFDGRSLQAVIGNPSDVRADQWAAFYFKKGASTTELSQRWGMDLQESPEAVLRSVESNQQFEKRYEKWCQCGDWGPDTFFNSVAPVAMVKEAAAFNPRQVAILANLHGKWDLLQSLMKGFNSAADMAGETKLPKLPGSGPFADFMHAMHAAIDQAMSIGSQVTRQSDAALAGLESQLSRFDESVSETEHGSATALSALAGSSEVSASVSRYSDGGSQPNYITESISISNGELVFQRDLSQHPELSWTARVLMKNLKVLSEPRFLSFSDQDSVWSVAAICTSGERGHCISRRGQGYETTDSELHFYFLAEDRARAWYDTLRSSEGSGDFRQPASITGQSNNKGFGQLPTELRAPVSRLNSATTSMASAHSQAAQDELDSAVKSLLDAATRSPGPPGSTTLINCNPQCIASVANGPGSKSAKINVSVNVGDMTMNASRTVGGNSGAHVMVGKVDVSQFAGLHFGDTIERAIQLFGTPLRAVANDEAEIDGVLFSVKFDNSRRITQVDLLDNSFLRSHGIVEPLTSLLGRSQEEAVELLGPSDETLTFKNGFPGNWAMEWFFRVGGGDGMLVIQCSNGEKTTSMHIHW